MTGKRQKAVVWNPRSNVYHHRRKLRWVRRVTELGSVLDCCLVQCGAVVARSPLYTSREGSELTAARLGLRPCARCFPQGATIAPQ